MNKSMYYTVLTVFLTVALQFVFIRFVSYGIDKETYGNFVLLQTLIAGLSASLLQLPGQAIDRFYNEENNKIFFINQFRTYLIIINLLSFVFIMIYGLIMEKFTNQVLFFVFILFLMMNIYALNQKFFLLNLERKKYMHLKVLEASARFLFPIIFYLFFQSLESLIVGMLIGYGLSLIILYSYMKNIPFSIQFNLDNFKKYFLYAYPFIFMTIFTWGISFSDRYFIEYYLKSSDVAIYAILAMVAGVGQIIGQIYSMYAGPKLLKIHSENENLAYTLIKKYLIILTFIFSGLFFVVLALPKVIFTIFIEKEIIYEPYYYAVFLILLVSIFLNVLHIAHHLYFKLFKKAHVLSYIYLLAFIVNIIGNLFIKNNGIIAAAISTALAYTVILILQIVYVQLYLRKLPLNA